MQWSLERIVPHNFLGDSQIRRIIKEYTKRLKKENIINKKRG